MSKMSRSEAGLLGAIKTNQLWAKRYYANPKSCRCCNKPLPYEKRKNKFCDHSCAASFNNLGLARNLGQGEYRQKPCLCCGVSTERKFCSQACCKNFQWQQIKETIERSGCARFSHTAKKYLLETRGNWCAECKISEWRGKQLVLVMDHINGNPYDWSLDNLRLLCPNCDSQTPTYKGKNAGNGRHARRERYRAGMSY